MRIRVRLLEADISHPGEVRREHGEIDIAPAVGVSAGVGSEEHRLVHPDPPPKVFDRSPD